MAILRMVLTASCSDLIIPIVALGAGVITYHIVSITGPVNADNYAVRVNPRSTTGYAAFITVVANKADLDPFSG